jgi:hypothetical protein
MLEELHRHHVELRVDGVAGTRYAAERRARFERRPAMSEQDERGRRVDRIAILYILGGIPAIVAFAVVLFTLVRFFPSIPA